MDEIFKEEQKDKNKNEIKYNVEAPKLITAPEKEKNVIPDPEKQKQDFQERNLQQMLTRKNRPKISRRLQAQLLDPDIYMPKKKKKNPPAYTSEKENNLKKESIITNKLSRKTIEKDKQIAREAQTEEEKMKLEMDNLEQYAKEKKVLMLSLNTDPGEADYISACVELDKVMKAKEICRTKMVDGPAKERALSDCQTLIDKAEIRLKTIISLQEEAKAKREKARKSKEETRKPTGSADEAVRVKRG